MSPSPEDTEEGDDLLCSGTDSSHVLVLILSTKHLGKSCFLVNSLSSQLQHSSLAGTPRISLFRMSPLALFCERDLWHVSTCATRTVPVTVWVGMCILTVICLCTVQFKGHLEAS